MTHVYSQQPSDASTLDTACAKGMALQLAGQLDLAGQLYRSILQAAPHHAAANYCFGMLHVQSHRALDGLPYLKTALLAQLEVHDYWLGYLEALLLVGRTTAARNILALGLQQGVTGPAVEDFAARLEAQSALAATRKIGLDAPPPASTVAKPRKGTRKSRRNEEVLIQRKEADLLSLVKQHKNAEALALARNMTERFPERGLGWKILGAFMPTDDGYEAALGAMQTAVRLMPRDAEAHVNLGVTLAKMKRFEEAESHLHKALELNPELAAAHFRLGMTLEMQGRYAEAEASLRRGRAVQLGTGNVVGDDELSYSHLLFLMSHNPSIGVEELWTEHRRYGDYVEGRLRASWPAHANERDPDRRLKIGFVSGDLYEHSVGQFLEPVAAHLALRADLELHAYCTHTLEDALSRRLQAHFKSWNAVEALSDTAFASKIMDERIDVLIDLSGHTGHNRLPVFARKPAPVQISWLGYPGTTGLRAVDYYLADPQWLPPGRFDRLFTEKLAYLPDRWAFKPHAAAPAVGPLPALSTGRLTFGSFHRLGKINSATIRLWSQLLLALPQATLLVLGVPVDGPEKRLLDEFAAHGVQPDRLTFHGRCTMDVYLAFHNQVDIALDTLTYAGATTTMHSLSMGVPTLTIAGATSQARAGAGILANVGLDQFIAADAEDFVAKARYWAAHPTELAELRTGLRARLAQSPAGQPPLIAARFASALRHMWRRWCAGSPAESFSSI